MPGDGPERPRKRPLRRLRGRGGATLPAKACEALRGPSAASEGHLRRPGPGGLGCAPPKAAPSDYATSMLRKSRKVIFVSLSRNRD